MIVRGATTRYVVLSREGARQAATIAEARTIVADLIAFGQPCRILQQVAPEHYQPARRLDNELQSVKWAKTWREKHPFSRIGIVPPSGVAGLVIGAFVGWQLRTEVRETLVRLAWEKLSVASSSTDWKPDHTHRSVKFWGATRTKRR